MTPDPVTGIGISWLWMLPDSHPFFQAATTHDKAYVDQFAGLINESSSKRADGQFLKDCLEVSDTFFLKLQAYVFYGAVRGWGMLRWPKPMPLPSMKIARQEQTAPSSPWIFT